LRLEFLGDGLNLGIEPKLRMSDAKAAMESAAAWINGLRKRGRPVFLGAPAVWDGMFVHWYFINFLS
jgi:hypothetical protein